MRKLRSLFLIIFLGSLNSGGILLFSQNYPFRQYTVSDGLPQSQSSGIYQDSRGFFWISTRNGLSRFDGIEFINYYRKDGLPTNFINQVFEDTDGNVYALSSQGLSRYDGSKFIFFPPPDYLQSIGYSTASSLGNDNNIILVYGIQTDGTPRLISFENGNYKEYSAIFPALDSIHISAFIYDNKTNSLVILDKNGAVFSWKNSQLLKISERWFKGLSREGDKIVLSDNDNKYIYSESKLNNYQSRAGTWIDESSISGRPEIAATLILHREGNQFLIKLPFGAFTGYIIDNENNVWFASERHLFRLLSTAFSTLDIPDALIKNIWALAEDKFSNIWLGSLYGNLAEYDGREYRLRNNYKTLFRSETGFFKGSRKMSDGDIYFSTNQGVIIYDGKSFSRINGIEDFTQVCYIYEDTFDKSVLIGTNRGLFHVFKDTIINYPEFIDSELGVIEGMVRIGESKYWLSGHKGLVLFDNEKFVVVKDSILPKADTYTIDTDKNDGLWVTSEEGLYFKDKNADSFIHALPEKINTPANSLLMIDSSNLLIGRTTDICIINLDKFYAKASDYYRIYDKSDGFSGYDCLDNGIIKSNDGRFLILTSGGVDILNTKHLKPNPIPPRIYITDIETATDSLTWEVINDPSLFYDQNPELRLTRDQNTVRIRFTGISTTNPEKVTYQYRLSGYEEKWSARNAGRQVVYEKLPPGSYTFQLKAYNADGIGTELPRSLSFRIKPAIWQTLLFKILVFLIIIAGTVLSTLKIMKERQKIKSEQTRLKSELAKLHMGSVLKQFDPHFTFNLLSSVGSLIIKGEKEVAYDYLLKLSALLRSVISNGSAIIKPLSEELEFVARYCEVQKLRFKERFDWSLNVDKNVNMQFEIPKLTIQIFVENALKHGIEPKIMGGRVDITLLNNGSGLEIKIVDNGIGREASGKENSSGTGNGIKIISRIFEHMNIENKSCAKLELTDLYDNETKSTGTEVKIFIPDGYHFGIYEQV
jgi:ligand-binding sensor domain-containing protein